VARARIKICTAKKSAIQARARRRGGGVGEILPRPSIKQRSAPPACSVRSRGRQKSLLFLLEEKIRRAQNQKSRENFFAGWRALASGGGAA